MYDILYNQGDTRWRNKQLGFGNKTIGQSGCLLCCLAMIIANHDAKHKDITPDKLNDEAKKNTKSFYGSGANVPKIIEPYNGIVFDVQALNTKEDVLRAKMSIKAHLQQNDGTAFIAGIDYKNGQSSGYSSADHFVVVEGIDDDLGGLTILDPANGTRKHIPFGIDGSTTYRDADDRVSELRTIIWKK